jgi:hypothetical protein
MLDGAYRSGWREDWLRQRRFRESPGLPPDYGTVTTMAAQGDAAAR